MKTFLVLLALITAAGGTVRADEPMTKVVYRAEVPNLTADSPITKPVTFYRWQSQMGRVEQAPDPVRHVQLLFIANGKDGWFINLLDKTGKHVVDPSSDHDFYAPIIPRQESGKPVPDRDFQIGRELAFMASRKIAPKPVMKNGQSFLLYECERDGYTLQFYVSVASGTPAESDVLKNGAPLVRLVYQEYDATLPPDPSLFQPPSDVKISEGRN